MLWANILQYAEPENRKGKVKWFAVDPDAIYPAVIDHLLDVQKGGSVPHPACLDRYYLEATFLPAPALKLALVPYGGLSDIRERIVRDQALEIARLWFTAAMQYAVDGPIGVHILRGSGKWRLYFNG